MSLPQSMRLSYESFLELHGDDLVCEFVSKNKEEEFIPWLLYEKVLKEIPIEEIEEGHDHITKVELTPELANEFITENRLDHEYGEFTKRKWERRHTR